MNPKIENLIKLFSKLPRVGGRAARRIVLSLLQDKTGKMQILSDCLQDTYKSVHICPNCGIATDSTSNLCNFCEDESRNNGSLCVVRDLGDVWTIEKTGIFKGRYHILGGLISGINGITPNDLNISMIIDRIDKEKIKEIIFVLPNTIEGKTTQHYVISLLSDFKDLIFSELASGMPLGGDLDYIDDGTLSLAFGERKVI